MVRRLLSRRSSADSGNTPQHDFTETLKGYEPPSFPALVSQALSELGDPECEIGSVADLIERDPGASARVLRLVNSAAMSPRSTITSIHHASMMLGKNQLEALLISVGAQGVLPNPTCASFEHRRFWATSARRAMLASALAERTDPTRRSENFTAALLQDMAVPVLALRADLYGDVLEHWHRSSDDLADIETSNYGWHHGMVASWMGTKWNFPQEFTHFMGQHHGPEATADLLPAFVVSPIRESDADGDELVIAAGATLLNLGSAEMAELMVTADEAAARFAETLT